MTRCINANATIPANGSATLVLKVPRKARLGRVRMLGVQNGAEVYSVIVEALRFNGADVFAGRPIDVQQGVVVKMFAVDATDGFRLNIDAKPGDTVTVVGTNVSGTASQIHVLIEID